MDKLQEAIDRDELQHLFFDIDNYLRNMNPPDDVWDAFGTLMGLAKAYADLPAKIERWKSNIEVCGRNDMEFIAIADTLDKVLNIIKEQHK